MAPVRRSRRSHPRRTQRPPAPPAKQGRGRRNRVRHSMPTRAHARTGRTRAPQRRRAPPCALPQSASASPTGTGGRGPRRSPAPVTRLRRSMRRCAVPRGHRTLRAPARPNLERRLLQGLRARPRRRPPTRHSAGRGSHPRGVAGLYAAPRDGERPPGRPRTGQPASKQISAPALLPIPSQAPFPRCGGLVVDD